jgi:hypothetical protein
MRALDVLIDLVGTAHINSSAGQSQSRNHQLLSNSSVNTYPRRSNSWINNLLLGKTYTIIFSIRSDPRLYDGRHSENYIQIQIRISSRELTTERSRKQIQQANDDNPLLKVTTTALMDI